MECDCNGRAGLRLGGPASAAPQGLRLGASHSLSPSQAHARPRAEAPTCPPSSNQVRVPGYPGTRSWDTRGMHWIPAGYAYQ
eukprot:3899298-Rhodomonas_salina.1